MDGFTFAVTGLLLTALVFLVTVFFVSVVAMLKNFLPHGLSGRREPYRIPRPAFERVRLKDRVKGKPAALKLI